MLLKPGLVMELDLIHATDMEILIKRKRKIAALLRWEAKRDCSVGDQNGGCLVVKCKIKPRGDGW